MAAIVSIAQMKAIETEADQRGVSFDRMMDLAGKAVGEAIAVRLESLVDRRIVLLCGSGNNGGDGLVAALDLAQKGADVQVFLAASRRKDDNRLQTLAGAGCTAVDAQTPGGREALDAALQQADVFVDAVFGTGAHLPLKPPVSEVLHQAGKLLSRLMPRPFMVAVDCPSGLNCDTGAVDLHTLPADLTVTFGAAKQGLLMFPGAEFTGELMVAPIGLPDGLKSMPTGGPWLATPEALAAWLKTRRRNSHKGSFGRTLIVGGSVNYPGAPVLSAMGAYRVGVGLVTVAVPGRVYGVAVPQLPEATWIVLPEDLGVIAPEAAEVLRLELTTVDSIVIGPGFGREKPTAGFLKAFLQDGSVAKSPMGFGTGDKSVPEGVRRHPPLVVDADALKMLAEMKDWTGMLPAGSVLTPHPGEMAVLTGLTREEIQAARTDTAVRFAKTWNHIVVLKGAFTVVAWPDGTAVIEPFATPALARAGTGDVLAGMIGGLIAQGMDSGRAAVLGAYLHGRAGEIAARDLHASDSVLATDVAGSIARAIAELRRG